MTIPWVPFLDQSGSFLFLKKMEMLFSENDNHITIIGLAVEESSVIRLRNEKDIRGYM